MLVKTIGGGGCPSLLRREARLCCLPSLCCLGEGSGEDAGDGKSLKRPLVTNFMAQYQTYQP
eukprot:3132490-Amphidinium_carterae.1